jgi:hypothetical protein
VSADDKSKVYGAPLPGFTASYAGFVNGDSPADLGGMLSFSTTATATAASHVSGSPYVIAASGLTATDYAITFQVGKLTVTPAPLTVSADDKSKAYGAPLPSFTASYNGLVNGDTPASLTGTLAFATTATARSHVAGGPYPILLSGLTSTDYTITFQPGKLTVTPAPMTVTADDSTKVYGAPMPAFTATYSGLVNGETTAVLGGALSFVTHANEGSHVSGGPYAVTPAGLTSTDYQITFVPGSMTVFPAPLTVRLNDVSRLFSQLVPAFTVAFQGLVNGDTPLALRGQLVFDPPATGLESVGPHNVTPAGLSSPDYSITFVPGTLTVTTVSTPVSTPATTPVTDPAPVSGSSLVATALIPLGRSSAGGDLGRLLDTASSVTSGTGLLLPARPFSATANPASGGGDTGGGGNSEAPGSARASTEAGLGSPDTLVRANPRSVPAGDDTWQLPTLMGRRQEDDTRTDGVGDELEDEDRLEQDRLFAAIGVRDFYHERDVFGELYPEPAEDRSSPYFGEQTEDVDPFATTVLWFVLTTIACEVALLRSSSS